MGSGARAADAAIQHVRHRLDASGKLEPQAIVRDADTAVRAAAHGGQTTLILVVIDRSGVRGSSVGDSEAWIVRDGGVTRLTERQRRKPLLGSGEAVAVPFGAAPLDGTLVVGSDGLFKYTSAAKSAEAARSPEVDGIPERLVDLVRLRSGSVPDDVAVVVCRADYGGAAVMR